MLALDYLLVASYPARLIVGHARSGRTRMGTLGFVCPTTGRKVDTGIEVDSLSFTSLHSEQLGCPECLETHQLSLIKVWVAETGPPEPAE